MKQLVYKAKVKIINTKWKLLNSDVDDLEKNQVEGIKLKN